ncbi:DUF5704 domain-containing protein [Paenibacillus sp. M1]|uniref:DUF5704 domain-containing protein n=1 Tax=Paenibacillus haidiansis TaxID=1574488 RepID=A0ABU7VMV8_9BACL
MKQLYKKLWIIVCIFVLVFPYLGTNTVYSDPTNPVDAKIVNGAIEFNITSTAASSSIRYKTIGWTVRREKACTYKSNGKKDDCNPRKDNNYVGFEGSKEVKQIKQDPPDPKPGEQVTTYFSVPEPLVSSGLKAHNMGDVKDGDEVFLSAIMISIDKNGNKRSGPWYTLADIKKAEGWAHPEDLDDYFDVRTIYNSAEYPIRHVYVRESKQDPKSPFDWDDLSPAKPGATVRYEINNGDGTTTDPNGREYTIVKSYLAPMDKPTERKFEVMADGTDKVFNRNFTVDLGGTYIVSVWREKCEDEEGGCGSQGGGEGDCTYTIQPPYEADIRAASVMDPEATGVILADDSANDNIHFDARQAIPTSEYLYANAWGLNYLFQNEFAKMEGDIVYQCTVDVTYPTKWEEEQDPIPGPDGEMIPQDPIPRTGTLDITYEFELEPREYSYWQINQLEVYEIDQAIMENYALPGGEVTLYPIGYDPPTIDLYNSTDVEEHVFPKNTGTISFTPQEIDGGDQEPTEADAPDDTEALKAIAESQTEDPDVKNDLFKFNDETIMDDSEVIQDGPEPSEIPFPEVIGDNVLYEGGQWISSSLLNKYRAESDGTIYYDLLPENVDGGSDSREFAINGINDVTVHTPVVNYSSVSDDQLHNQKTKPNTARAALILERPFTVRIPTNGQHIDERQFPGYGDRNYSKYFRTKQVLFPFDVYTEDKTQFIPQFTWIDIPVDQLDTTFYLPVWVDEGDYQVYFRNIAENSPYDYKNQGEPDFNEDLIHHMATDEVSVEVIGRVYDFHVTDIADYNWEPVFRTGKGSTELRGLSYWIGQRGIDGDPRGNSSIYTLPIHPGSHPLKGYKNVAIKTGYHFKFDFKTKGNMFGQLDGIRITPSFYYAPKSGTGQNGTERIPVDLYYKTNTRQFVKIGSPEDQVQRYVILNDRMRNVPTEELGDTAAYKFAKYDIFGNLTKQQYVKQYLEKFTKQKTPVGGYSLLFMPEQLRTFIGPKKDIPESVDKLRANASIQKWYGEYSLPADPYVVEAGTNIAEYGRTHGGLDEKSPIFLKDGYIIVNFNIETIRDDNLSEPHLQYIHAPMMNLKEGNDKKRENQWEMEGYPAVIRDSFGHPFKLEYGDVAFYHADKSSRDDFSSQVPQ